MRKDNDTKKSIKGTLLSLGMFVLFCFILNPAIGAVALIGSIIWLTVSVLGL